VEQSIPLVARALGGAILGPIVDRLAEGGGTGGVVAHFCANAAGLGPLSGDAAMRGHVQSFLEGIIGGGFLAATAGTLVTKSQADGYGGCLVRPAPFLLRQRSNHRDGVTVGAHAEQERDHCERRDEGGEQERGTGEMHGGAGRSVG